MLSKNRFELFRRFSHPSVTYYKQTTYAISSVTIEKPLRSTPHKSPAENFGAWKKIFGAGNFFFGARIFPSRRQDFGAGLPQKAKISHKTLHKGAVLCKKCLIFSLFCLAGSKAVSRESAKIRQKETCSAFGVTFCQTRVGVKPRRS